MATRTISTRLAVHGESEYKAAISSVNAELRNMQSALKMTKSQYKDNANSIEALTAKDKALNDLLTVQKQKVSATEAGLKNAQQAVTDYTEAKEALTRKINENAQALQELKNKAEDTTEEEKRLINENKDLNQALKKNEAYLESANKAVTNWKTDLNKAKTAVNETEAAIKSNSVALDANKNKTNANAEAIEALAAAMVASGLKATISEITQALIECIDASIEFESAMAGVAKTTDLTKTELRIMSDDIKELSTDIPITTTELAGIVEVAGQLGIQKESLLSFSKTMAALGVSTNLTSEEAATLLARFSNVVKMNPELYENLGSVVVSLGNNFATTEKEIVALAQRLAAAGELAGLTEPEIMALATAMSSVGIEAEAGGTAMTQTMTAMEEAVVNGGENLTKFADISGMTAAQFSAAWQSNPIEAIEAFIVGLGRMDEHGESATLVLEEMGLSGVRQSNMLKSLASASDLLSYAVDVANIAWAENTALMTEANTRYQTTESKLQILENSANNLKIAVGDQLTPALGDLADTGLDVLEWATDFAEANEWLAPTIASVAASMSVLLGYTVTATVAVPLLKKAWTALNASFLASPTGLVITGISMVTAAVVTLAATLPSASEEAMALRDAMSACADTMETAEDTYEDTSKNIIGTSKVLDAYIDRLEELEAQATLTDTEQNEYNRLVSEVSRLLPEANTQIDENTNLLEAGASALRKNAEEWENMAKEAAETARINAMVQGLTDAYIAVGVAQDELTVAQSAATEQTLAYADAYKALVEAQEWQKDVQSDSSSADFYYENEAAMAAVEEAQGKLLESAKGLTEEEKEAGAAIGELSAALDDAQTNVDAYEEKVALLNKSAKDTGDSAQKIADGVERTTDALETAGDVSGEGIREGFADGLQGMGEAASAEMANTESIVTAAGKEIAASATDSGNEAAVGLTTSLAEAKGSVKQTMSDINQTVKSSKTDAYNAGYEVGKAIAQGSKVGIEDYASRVAKEAADMVTDAIQAAKDAAAINSPSKKMIPIGQGLDEGVIVGIKNLEDDVKAAMAETMDNVMDVQVEVPEIPDNTTAILSAMGSAGNHDDKLAKALSGLAKKKVAPSINVIQYIDAKETSYAGQQREAKRQMKVLSRELSR